jgi:hypothetical protein
LPSALEGLGSAVVLAREAHRHSAWETDALPLSAVALAREGHPCRKDAA